MGKSGVVGLKLERSISDHVRQKVWGGTGLASKSREDHAMILLIVQ